VLLVTSLTHVSGTMASVQTFTFTFVGNDKGLRGYSKKICKPTFNTDIRKYFFLKSSH